MSILAISALLLSGVQTSNAVAFGPQQALYVEKAVYIAGPKGFSAIFQLESPQSLKDLLTVGRFKRTREGEDTIYTLRREGEDLKLDFTIETSKAGEVKSIALEVSASAPTVKGQFVKSPPALKGMRLWSFIADYSGQLYFTPGRSASWIKNLASDKTLRKTQGGGYAQVVGDWMVSYRPQKAQLTEDPVLPRQDHLYVGFSPPVE